LGKCRTCDGSSQNDPQAFCGEPALQQFGGTFIRTSLSEEDTKKLQDALTPEPAAATPQS
jgi:hypothetical protein